MRGRFVTLEGGEGVGKSTQLRRLAETLRQTGREVVETREPGGSEGAEAIRGLLMTGTVGRWTARAEALLFAAARADHLDKTILPALARGAWVVCDRFIDSSRAYQGGADGLGDAEILALHAIGSEGLMPDRTLLLTLPVLEGASRAFDRDNGRGDRFGERGAEYHARVARAFQSLAEADPDRFRIIDASGTPEEVTTRLLAALGGL